MNTPHDLLLLIGSASLRASALILLLLALRPWLRRLFGSSWVSLLWLVVLARLLLPWSVESRWSAWPLLSKAAPLVETAGPWKTNVTITETKAENHHAPPAVLTIEPRTAADREHWLFWIWAAGAFIALLYFGTRIWQTGGMVRRAALADDPRLLRIFESLPAALRGRAKLRVTDEIQVAALAGAWRPQILLPRAWLPALNDGELRHVLLHELGHARRGDLAVQWLFALAQCLHWFNPLVWLTTRRVRIDAELACDAWVLARGTESNRESYGDTLLKTSQLFRNQFPISPLAIGMAASRETLVARVRHVSAYRTVARWRAVLAGLLAAGIVSLLMTHQSAAQPPATVTPAPAPATSETKPAAEPPAEPESKAPEKAAPPEPRGPQIEIESKFIEVSEAVAKKLGLLAAAPDEGATIGRGKKPVAETPLISLTSVLEPEAVTQLLQKLNQSKDVDLLSAPRVATRSGQRARIEIIREFRYATEYDRDKTGKVLTPTAFETRNLGVTLEVAPIVDASDNIDLHVVPEVVELEGYMRPSNGQPVPLRGGRGIGANLSLQDFANTKLAKNGILQPIFSTRKVTTDVTLISGNTVLLGGLKRDMVVEGKAPISRMLYILITAKVSDREATAVASVPVAPTALTPAGAVKAGNEDLPVAEAVTGKPGFILSPFAPKAGYIDVRGFPAGTQIKCPYSGKIFRTP